MLKHTFVWTGVIIGLCLSPLRLMAWLTDKTLLMRIRKLNEFWFLLLVTSKGATVLRELVGVVTPRPNVLHKTSYWFKRKSQCQSTSPWPVATAQCPDPFLRGRQRPHVTFDTLSVGTQTLFFSSAFGSSRSWQLGRISSGCTRTATNSLTEDVRATWSSARNRGHMSVNMLAPQLKSAPRSNLMVPWRMN